MLVLMSILALFLIRYVFAAPSMIVSRQDLGEDQSSIRLPSSLDEKTSEMVKKIKQELGPPISERDEFPSNEIEKQLSQSLPSSQSMARSMLAIRYPVPGTQITIVVALGGPIARVALAHAVLLANTVLNHRVQDFGADTQLPVSSDPYHIQSSDGAFVHIHSNRQDHRHLTYGIMAAAAEGLWDVMIGQHNYHEAHFQIFEAGVGLMGGGRIRGANQ